MTIENLFCKLLSMKINKYLFISIILIPGFLAAEDLKEKLQADLDPFCLLYTSPSPRDRQKSRMPSSA